jgi:tetratricopeptide (TPR) repeat protein
MRPSRWPRSDKKAQTVLFVLGALLALCRLAPSDQSERPECRTAVECNTRGTAALKAGKFKAAIADFFAALTKPDGSDVDAFNNLGSAYIRQQDFLMARFWTEQALDLKPNAPAATRNLATVQAKLRGFKWPALHDGLYMQYIGCGMTDDIRISGSTGKSASLSFQGVRLSPDECRPYPAATGELQGQISIDGQSGLYRASDETASCKIDLQFRDNGLTVSEEGECGFGSGVHADGDFSRVSIR